MLSEPAAAVFGCLSSLFGVLNLRKNKAFANYKVPAV
jgi:hypothetical protein